MVEVILTDDRVQARCELVASERVRLHLATGDQIDLAVTPDRCVARRTCGLARRILRVELDASSGRWSARVTAVWHRVPRTVPLPLGAAVALMLQGVPGTVSGLHPS